MLDIRSLLTKFKPANDRETVTAYFQTHVPWVAPLAYLNIIYKPAPPEPLAAISEKLKIPEPVVDLLAQQNGAILFSGSFSIDGVVATGTLLNRSDPFSLPPYNIESANRSSPPPNRDQWLKIGWYGYDGAGVCIDRQHLDIVVFRRGEKTPCAHWQNLEKWITTEITRLSALFDPDGKRLVQEHETLPYPAQ